MKPTQAPAGDVFHIAGIFGTNHKGDAVVFYIDGEMSSDDVRRFAASRGFELGDAYLYTGNEKTGEYNMRDII
jgi:hypothetical protein